MDNRNLSGDQFDERGGQLELPAAGGPTSPFDEIRRMDEDGEHWFARDLMPELDYGTDWRKFSDAIARAMEACRKSGFDVAHHFVARDKMVPIGSGAFRAVSDYRLTRYASFLVAQNGNPKRPAIARAQTYFAAQTHKQEIAEKQAMKPTTDLAVPDTTTPEGVLVVLDMLRDQVMARMNAERQVEERDEKIAILGPKAAEADHHRAADGCMAIGDFANKLKAWALQNCGIRILHEDVWDFLGDIGLIIRGNTVRKNQPTAFATERDFVRTKTTRYETKTRGEQVSTSSRLTPPGAGWAWDRAVKRLNDFGSLRKSMDGAA